MDSVREFLEKLTSLGNLQNTKESDLRAASLGTGTKIMIPLSMLAEAELLRRELGGDT